MEILLLWATLNCVYTIIYQFHMEEGPCLKSVIFQKNKTILFYTFLPKVSWLVDWLCLEIALLLWCFERKPHQRIHFLKA